MDMQGVNSTNGYPPVYLNMEADGAHISINYINTHDTLHYTEKASKLEFHWYEDKTTYPNLEDFYEKMEDLVQRLEHPARFLVGTVASEDIYFGYFRCDQGTTMVKEFADVGNGLIYARIEFWFQRLNYNVPTSVQ
jgi:hypothetical protein